MPLTCCDLSHEKESRKRRLREKVKILIIQSALGCGYTTSSINKMHWSKGKGLHYSGNLHQKNLLHAKPLLSLRLNSPSDRGEGELSGW